MNVGALQGASEGFGGRRRQCTSEMPRQSGCFHMRSKRAFIHAQHPVPQGSDATRSRQVALCSAKQLMLAGQV